MTAIATDKLKRFFVNKLFADVADSSERYYLGIGESQDWDSADLAPSPLVTNVEERKARLKLQSLKSAETNSFVVPRYNWVSGTTYEAVNDALVGQTNYYVFTDENKVFLCLQQGKSSFGNSVTSSVKPTGESRKPLTTADGYVWQYLYTISALKATQFVSANFIPVQKVITAIDANETKQKQIQDSAVVGEILGINVTSGGTGYTGAPTVLITGRGQDSGGSSLASGGHKTTLIKKLAKATATVSGGAVVKIEMDDSGAGKAYGAGYDFASVTLSGGGGTGAKATPILSMDSGVGGDPRKDLRSFGIMFNAKLTGTENSKFIVGNDFRQVTLIKNPMIPKESSLLDSAVQAGAEIALRSLKFATITQNFTSDRIIQGVSSTARAYVDNFDSTRLHFHQTEETGFAQFAEGETIQETNGNGEGVLLAATGDADSDAFTESGINIASGEMLFIDNRAAVTRATGQTEDIKIVVQL